MTTSDAVTLLDMSDIQSTETWMFPLPSGAPGNLVIIR
jgi:hypothetical protein